jgi:hypothetical protein
MARTSRRTMTMIAMTMLPDMVVVVLEGWCCGDLGGFGGGGLVVVYARDVFSLCMRLVASSS